jgi:hypothetical protein
MANGICTKCASACTMVHGELICPTCDAASAVRHSSPPRLKLNSSARRRRLHERLAPWGAALLVIILALAAVELVTKFGRRQLNPPKPRPPVVEEVLAEKQLVSTH